MTFECAPWGVSLSVNSLTARATSQGNLYVLIVPPLCHLPALIHATNKGRQKHAGPIRVRVRHACRCAPGPCVQTCSRTSALVRACMLARSCAQVCARAWVRTGARSRQRASVRWGITADVCQAAPREGTQVLSRAMASSPASHRTRHHADTCKRRRHGVRTPAHASGQDARGDYLEKKSFLAVDHPSVSRPFTTKLEQSGGSKTAGGRGKGGSYVPVHKDAARPTMYRASMRARDRIPPRSKVSTVTTLCLERVV